MSICRQLRALVSVAVAAVILLCAGRAMGQQAAKIGAGLETDEDGTPDVEAKVDLSQTVAFDDQTSRTISFGDLRATADATGMGVLPLTEIPISMHLDGRVRSSWNEATDDHIAVRQAYVGLGEGTGRWQLNLGRQVVRNVASAEIDGALLQRKIGEQSAALVFGGLVPNPITGAIMTDLIGFGAGYDQRNDWTNNAGGIVTTLYGDQVDRAYWTQQSYVRVGQRMSLFGLGIVDFVKADAMSPSTEAHASLTSATGMVRVRPAQRVDSTVSVAHHQTILPGKWWNDWLNERRRAIGFVLDGDDPVGTRITSARWMNNLHLTETTTPYLGARYDRRHTDAARGYEGRAGLKWVPTFGYADVSYAYRSHFNSINHLGALTVGIERDKWGLESGLLVLRSRPREGGQRATSYDAHAMGLVALDQLFDLRHRIHLLGQYQALFEPEATLHAVFVQVGYRR